MANNINEFINAGTGGLWNRLSLTQNIRYIYDTFKNGWQNPLDYNSSWWGNNGIVTDEFAAEHPYISMAINSAVDGLRFRIKPFNPRTRYKINLNDGSWHNWGDESFVNVDLSDQNVYKVSKTGSRSKTGLGFQVRRKLEANNIPGHLPYYYEGYTKADGKYFPIFKQTKVKIPGGEQAIEDISSQLKQGGFKVSTVEGDNLQASNRTWNIFDIYKKHNTGTLNGKGVMFDAKLGQGTTYPLFWFNNNFTHRITNPIYIMGGINGQNNTTDKNETF